MTHDVSAMFDLEKVFNEVSEHCKKLSEPSNPKKVDLHAEYCIFKLENNLLSPFPFQKYNEYSNLLQRVYSYSQSTEDDPQEDTVIGNCMRRVLEAFSTFTYKLGINDVSVDDRVLAQLPVTKRKYYRNLMYRLVLQNESHCEDNIRAAPELSFFNHLSTFEKKRTARDILCFMYYLDKDHLLSQLPSARPSLEKWCSDTSTN